MEPNAWQQGLADLAGALCLPDVDAQVVKGLKFGEALPPRLAEATLAARFTDTAGAAAVLAEPAEIRLAPAGA